MSTIRCIDGGRMCAKTWNDHGVLAVERRERRRHAVRRDEAAGATPISSGATASASRRR
jgi:hypothetical protein